MTNTSNPYATPEYWEDRYGPTNAEKAANPRTYVLRPIPPRPPMEAVQLTEHNLDAVAKWADRTVMITGGVKGIRVAWPRSDYSIDAFPCDWIVRDPQGNLTIMSDVLFHRTYMPTDSEIEGE